AMTANDGGRRPPSLPPSFTSHFPLITSQIDDGDDADDGGFAFEVNSPRSPPRSGERGDYARPSNLPAFGRSRSRKTGRQIDDRKMNVWIQETQPRHAAKED